MKERLKIALNSRPSSDVCAKFFDGIGWTQLKYDQLLNDVKVAVGTFEKLLIRGQLVAFCISPCLALPSLVLSATLSSCPFVFLNMKISPISDSLLHKLKLHWVVTDEMLTDERFKFVGNLEILTTRCMIYEVTCIPKNDCTLEECETYLYATTTSGSTGTPKVIRVPEQSIMPNILDFSHKLGLTPSHGILLSTPLTFDPAILEIFLPIIVGSPMIIVSNDVKKSPALLSLAIDEGKAAFYQTTPSLFRLWDLKLKLRLLGHESNLKVLILGGEKFPLLDEVKTWEPKSNVQIYNTYGLSEVSCWATLNCAFPNDNWKNFSEFGLDVGECLTDTQLKFTKDESNGLHHAMIGSSTRICAIENEKFKKLTDQKPVFRSTGDFFEIVDGKYYFSRRSDTSVKRMGKRISLSLIDQKSQEVGLESVASIRSLNNDYNRIIMFVVGEKHMKDLAGKLELLKKLLPEDHWPDDVEFVKNLPLSLHGKIDRNALETYVLSKPARSYFTFVEYWNLFTSGSKHGEPTNKGFVASGGNSFTAILFVNTLKDAGYPDDSNLLLALLKDESLSKCWESFSSIKGSRKRKCENERQERIEKNEDVLETNVCSTTETSACKSSCCAEVDQYHRPLRKTKGPRYEQISSSPVAMALKGEIWPRNSLVVDPVWRSKRLNIQTSWTVDLLKCVDASPLAIVNSCSYLNYLIVGSHSGLVVTLRCDSGNEISRVQLPDRVEASACLSRDHSAYYIGCYDGNIYCINLTSGLILWTFQTQDMVKSTCVVYCDKIFVGSYDKYMYALTDEGALLWKQFVGPVTIPVLPFEDTVIVGTLSSKIWRLSVENGQVLSQIDIGSPLFANLKLTTHPGHESCILVAPVEGPLQWRDALTFDEVEELYLEGQKFASPVITNGTTMIVACGNTVHSLQLLTRRWSKQFQNRIVSTPFVIGSQIIVTTIDGTLHLLDFEGVALSTHCLGGEVFSSPVVVGSHVFVGCRDNKLYCLDVSS